MNRRNHDIPPTRLARHRGIKADKTTCAAAGRNCQYSLSCRPVVAMPEIQPGFVQERRHILDAQRFVCIAHRQQVALQIQHFDAVWAAFDNAAIKSLGFMQRVLCQHAVCNVFENNGQSGHVVHHHRGNAHLQPTFTGNQFTLEPDWRAKGQCRVIGGVPVFGNIWKQLSNGFADHSLGRVSTRLHGKSKVGFNINKVQRLACQTLYFFNHTKPIVQGVEQRAVMGLGDGGMTEATSAGASTVRIRVNKTGQRACLNRQMGVSPGKSVVLTHRGSSVNADQCSATTLRKLTHAHLKNVYVMWSVCLLKNPANVT